MPKQLSMILRQSPRNRSATKRKRKKTNDGDISGCADAITEAKDGLMEAVEARKGANHELMKLKPMCVDGGETYAERVKKREQEIEALKQAMTLLDEWQS